MVRPPVFSALIVLALASADPLFAQSRPDFSGAWVVDSVETSQAPSGNNNDSDRGRRGIGGREFPDGRARGGDRQMPTGDGRGRGGSADVFAKGDRVAIAQQAESLVIIREANGQRTTYALDGSEVTQSGADGAEIKTRTRWDGVALVTETSQAAARGSMTFRTRQVRTLSADGKTMTLTTSIDTPRGPISTKVTFTRE